MRAAEPTAKPAAEPGSSRATTMRRLNFIALFVFLAALVWVFTWKSPTTLAVRGRMMSVFSPFVRTGASVQDVGAGNVARRGKSPSELAEENVRLQPAGRGTANLFRGIRAAQKRERRIPADARICAQPSAQGRAGAHSHPQFGDSGRRRPSSTAGLRDGLASDLPVRTAEGLVGKVVEVWSRESQVIFITDEACKVAVQHRRESGPGDSQRHARDFRADAGLADQRFCRVRPTCPSAPRYTLPAREASFRPGSWSAR